MIKQYVGNIFTHEGQCEVADFANELLLVASALKLVSPKLNVIYGYHGTLKGDWAKDFDAKELAAAATIAVPFEKADLVKVVNPGMNDSQIKNAVAKGNVFFTWCDSDKRVKTAMGNKMPKSV